MLIQQFLGSTTARDTRIRELKMTHAGSASQKSVMPKYLEDIQKYPETQHPFYSKSAHSQMKKLSLRMATRRIKSQKTTPKRQT